MRETSSRALKAAGAHRRSSRRGHRRRQIRSTKSGNASRHGQPHRRVSHDLPPRTPLELGRPVVGGGARRVRRSPSGASRSMIMKPRPCSAPKNATMFGRRQDQDLLLRRRLLLLLGGPTIATVGPSGVHDEKPPWPSSIGQSRSSGVDEACAAAIVPRRAGAQRDASQAPPQPVPQAPRAAQHGGLCTAIRSRRASGGSSRGGGRRGGGGRGVGGPRDRLELTGRAEEGGRRDRFGAPVGGPGRPRGRRASRSQYPLALIHVALQRGDEFGRRRWQPIAMMQVGQQSRRVRHRGRRPHRRRHGRALPSARAPPCGADDAAARRCQPTDRSNRRRAQVGAGSSCGSCDASCHPPTASLRMSRRPAPPRWSCAQPRVRSSGALVAAGVAGALGIAVFFSSL